MGRRPMDTGPRIPGSALRRSIFQLAGFVFLQTISNFQIPSSIFWFPFSNLRISLILVDFGIVSGPIWASFIMKFLILLFKRGARTPPGHALLGVRACDVHALLGYGLVAWRIIEVVPFFWYRASVHYS